MRLESNKESSHYLSSNDQSFANEHQSAFLSKVQNTFLIANGEEIADFNQLPVSPQQTDVVYDGSNGRAWIWDIAFDYQVRQQFYADFKFFFNSFQKKIPVIVYARFPSEKEHYYHYARWSHQQLQWVDTQLVFAGSWFPQTFGKL